MICVSRKLDDKIRRSSNHIRKHWRLIKDIKTLVLFFYIKIMSLFSMEKDKTREYENKQIFVESSVSKETCLFSCIWSNCCRYLFFTIEDQLKHIIIIKRWTHSSYEDDDIKRYMKRRLTLSSHKRARHQSRIKLHAIFINVKIDPHRGGRSSCTAYFPNTLIWSKISCPEVTRTWS